MNRRTFLGAAESQSSLSLLAGCTSRTVPESTASTGETATLSSDESALPSDLGALVVPAGFRASLFADGVSLGGGEFRPGPEPGPRLLAAHEGVLYATIPSQGRVVAFSLEGRTATDVTTVVTDLDRSHGIDVSDGQLSLATADQLLR